MVRGFCSLTAGARNDLVNAFGPSGWWHEKVPPALHTTFTREASGGARPTQLGSQYTNRRLSQNRHSYIPTIHADNGCFDWLSIPWINHERVTCPTC